MHAILVVLVFVCLAPDYTTSNVVPYEYMPAELKTGDPNDKHGGIKMGISSDQCDNAKDFIEVDWNNTKEDYTCYEGTLPYHDKLRFVKQIETKKYDPIHICLPNPIHYTRKIPTSGRHRPLWPKYGEYLYLPPQRWVHSLEHGAAVFLYHPCVDKPQLDYFKEIAFNCLKKIIITPYRNVPKTHPFVIATYGTKLMLNRVHRDLIENFIQENVWQNSEEKHAWNDGSFSAGLLRSSYKNSKLQNNYKTICSKKFRNAF